MFYAVKGNKQLKIDETEKDAMLKLGYDIAEQKGDELKIIETGVGKTVSWKQYNALAEENANLKKQIAAAGSGMPEALNGMKVQLADAQKEIESLTEQLAAAKSDTETKKTAKADK